MNNENIRAAIDKVVSSSDMSIRPMHKDDEGPAGKQVLIRTTESDRENWKKVSDIVGLTLSAWIRETLNEKARTFLDCDHPESFMRSYPWAVMCTKCGRRINDQDAIESKDPI